jgi:hypothetical protein
MPMLFVKLQAALRHRERQQGEDHGQSTGRCPRSWSRFCFDRR